MRARRCAGCDKCLQGVERDECSSCGKMFCADCLILDDTCTTLCFQCLGEGISELNFDDDYFSRIRPDSRYAHAEFDREDARYPEWDSAPEYSPAVM